jgi:hypothetical protein
MKNSTPIFLAHLDAWLAELDDDLMLLEQTGRRAKVIKRSLVRLRQKAEAAVNQIDRRREFGAPPAKSTIFRIEAP